TLGSFFRLLLAEGQIFYRLGDSSGLRAPLPGSSPEAADYLICAFEFLRGSRPHLRAGMRTSILLVGLLFSVAASAQTYPVSGVWVAMDYHFPESKRGACLTLKTLGVDALFGRSFPTVMIFSHG